MKLSCTNLSIKSTDSVEVWPGKDYTIFVVSIQNSESHIAN